MFMSVLPSSVSNGSPLYASKASCPTYVMYVATLYSSHGIVIAMPGIAIAIGRFFQMRYNFVAVPNFFPLLFPVCSEISFDVEFLWQRYTAVKNLWFCCPFIVNTV